MLLLFIAVLFFGFVSFVGIDVNAASSLEVVGTVSESSLYTGETLNLSASASGGTPVYQYKFSYKTDDSSWILAKNYSAENKASVTLSKAGSYTFRMYAKDSQNKISYSEKKVTVIASAKPLSNNSKLSASVMDYGSTLTIYGKASGGTAPYRYHYSYKCIGGSWITHMPYSSVNQINVNLPSAGYYTIRVLVKDKTEKMVEKNLNVIIINKTTKVLSNLSQVSTSRPEINSSVKITAVGNGGTQPYKYSFYYQYGSENWKTLAEKTKVDYSSFKPAHLGSYQVKCVVYDYNGNSKEKIITVSCVKTTGKILSNTSKIDLVTDQIYKAGINVNMTAAASGGTRPYQYAYSYQFNDETSRTIKAYSNTAACSFQLADTGSYKLRISVKDAAGKILHKDYHIETVAALKDVKSYQFLSYGSSYYVQAENAGTGAQYAIYYKKSTDTSWICAKSYSTTRTALIRPRYLGQYIIRISTMKNGTVTNKDTSITTVISDEVKKEFALINQQRSANGLKTISLDNELCFAAGVRAEELNSEYAHTRPDGSAYLTVFSQYGIGFTSAVAENIGSGYDTVEDVMDAWMRSSGHRAHILSKEYTKVGIGVNGNKWSLIFTN